MNESEQTTTIKTFEFFFFKLINMKKCFIAISIFVVLLLIFLFVPFNFEETHKCHIFTDF
jgi:hypothetical protein